MRLVKIDTQGHELEVVRGMKRMLAANTHFNVILELDHGLQRASGLYVANVNATTSNVCVCVAGGGGPRWRMSYMCNTTQLHCCNEWFQHTRLYIPYVCARA